MFPVFSCSCQKQLLFILGTIAFWLGEYIVFWPGEYIYIETSAPQRPGQKAVLTSQVIPINTGIPDFCFTFWYHMSGTTIGTLNVTYSFVGGNPHPGFSRSGDQGSQWIQGFLPIATPYENFVVRA